MILSRETIAGRPTRAGNKQQALYSKQVTDAAAREDDLAIVGVHAMLFDDDAAAGFINSPEALVPWNGDEKLLIDRYDVRHLLEDLTGFRRRRAWTPTDASDKELNHERYKDLQDDTKDVQSTSQETPSGEEPSGGDYNSVSFDYGTDQKTSPSHSKEIEEPFVPPFPVPDYLQPHMPTSQKIHQIISGTAKFVSEHGGQAEIVLRVKQSHNPTFGFLMPDHPLHPYFRYLVDHPVLTGATTKSSQPGNASLCMPAEGLRLLGEVYGGDNEEDEDSTPHGSERLAAETDGPYTPPAPSIQTKDLGKLVKEPPPHVKVVIGKMVEFIARNGKDFEEVVRDRDKADRRFHFLRPWNEYHPYYLKMLQNASQTNPAVTSGSGSGAISRRKPLPKPLAQGHLKGSTGNAGNLNEGKQQSSQAARGRSRFDVTPNMLQSIAPVEITHVDCTGNQPVVDVEATGTSGNYKEEALTKDSDKEQFGMSYDAAFAAVMAATRGMRKSREKSPLALTTADRGGAQQVPANSEARKEDSGSGGQVSVEASSTDLQLTAEERKAERLRKAKRLAEVIKSGNDAVEIAESSEATASRFTDEETAAVCAGDNSFRMEDVRTEKEVSSRKHHHLRHHRHHDKEDYEHKIEKRKRQKCMDKKANSETESLDHISWDKRSKNEDAEASDYEHCHKKRRHSDEKGDYEHRRERRKGLDGDKSSKYEYRKHRRRSTYDEREDKHRRRHRKHHSSHDDKQEQEQRGSTPGTEISDDIRAKVRAMLSQI